MALLGHRVAEVCHQFSVTVTNDNLKNGYISQTSNAVILKFCTYLRDTFAIIWAWLLFNNLEATPFNHTLYQKVSEIRKYSLHVYKICNISATLTPL